MISMKKNQTIKPQIKLDNGPYPHPRHVMSTWVHLVEIEGSNIIGRKKHVGFFIVANSSSCLGVKVVSTLPFLKSCDTKAEYTRKG